MHKILFFIFFLGLCHIVSSSQHKGPEGYQGIFIFSDVFDDDKNISSSTIEITKQKSTSSIPDNDLAAALSTSDSNESLRSDKSSKQKSSSQSKLKKNLTLSDFVFKPLLKKRNAQVQ